jgi:hypothetical protein
MDVLEHYEDNLNTNISNSKLVDEFIKRAVEVHTALKAKYQDVT